MIKSVKCLDCGNQTQILIRRIRTKHLSSVILLKNAPVFYCPNCGEVIIPFQVITVFKHLKARPLNSGTSEFNFQEVYSKLNVE